MAMLQPTYRRNLYLLLAISFITAQPFWFAIEKLFYGSIGITAAGIGLILAFNNFYGFIFEFPSGVLADRWGRKKSLILYVMFSAIACIALGKSTTVTMVVIAFSLWGLGRALSSGTFDAIMYDSLKELGRKDEYEKYKRFSRLAFVAWAFISIFLGGVIANKYGFPMAYFSSGIVLLLGLPFVLLLKETTFHQKDKILSTKKHFKDSFRYIFMHRKSIEYMIVIIVLSVSVITYWEYFPLQLTAIGIDSPIWQSRIMLLMPLIDVIGIITGFKFAKKFISKKYFWTAIFAMLVSYFVFATVHSYWAILFFPIPTLVFSIIIVRLNALINELIPSNIRASVNSAISLLEAAVSIIIMLSFGIIASRFSIFVALYSMAVLMTIYLIYYQLFAKDYLFDK